jgi:cytochrome c-type biogenesis protein CcmH
VRAAFVIGALLFGIAGPVAAQKATQFEVEESLTCQCGCGLTVHSCNHLNCSSGEPIKAEIAERLARGEDKATILAAFQAKFGEKVLSAPTFRGLNWFAWLVPGAGVLFGALVLAVTIRRRASLQANAAPVAAAGGPANDALRAKLDDALADYDEDA